MSNGLRRYVMSPPYHERIARGDVGAVAVGEPSIVAPVRRAGHNDACAATYETVWCASDSYTYLTSTEKLKINSSDSEDNASGTGARTVFVKGLDSSYDIISETVTLHATDGTIAVTTSKSYLRVFILRAETAGSVGSNKGDVYIKNNASTITLEKACAGEGKSLAAIWTVPNNKTAIILGGIIGEMAQKKTEFGLFIRPQNKAWYIARLSIIKNQTVEIKFLMPLKFEAKTDIEVRAKADAGSGIVIASFDGYYY